MMAVRYKCHVGQQYSHDTLLVEQSDAVEGALWSVVRVLEEQAELRARMASRADAAGLGAVSAGFADRAQDAHEQAPSMRRLLFARGRRNNERPEVHKSERPEKPDAARRRTKHRRKTLKLASRP
jgi:hypothetical protein